MRPYFWGYLKQFGNLEPFWNHFGNVLRHLEQFFGHLEDIFEVSVFRRPHGLKNGSPRDRSERFFSYTCWFFLLIFWVHFLANFWPSFGPPLGVSLGVSWEPSRASWNSLGRPLHPKTLKNWRFFKVFDNAAFWLFEAPDGSLGLILPPLWPIWSQNGPQNCSQKCPKKEPKIVHFFLFFLCWSQHKPT